MPILFYARGPIPTAAATKKRAPDFQQPNRELLDGLKSLGLVATSSQVEAAIKMLFSRGIEHIDAGELIRKVAIHLKSKAS